MELSQNEIAIINMLRALQPFDQLTIRKNKPSDPVEYGVETKRSVMMQRMVVRM